MEPKSFDINAPGRVNPSANSRPVIVGHRPVMTDPMMRPAQPSPMGPQVSAPVATHTAKVIQVSDEVRNNLIDSQAVPVAPPASVDAPLAAAPEPTAPQQMPAPPLADNSIPATDSSSQPPAPAVALPPVPEQELNLPHVPIAHAHQQQGKIKNTILWVLVIGFLFALGGYLLIDAGLLGSNINLPVHIFHQSAQGL